jgi:NAD(P)-dependent dehydrogenase (short-subunit alcohol dehydrogenase family)
MRFDKKVALVTGSSRGIGLAIARRLVAERCAVVLTGRNELEGRAAAAALAEESGVGDDNVLFVAGDLNLDSHIRLRPRADRRSVRQARRSRKQRRPDHLHHRARQGD